MRKKRFPIAIEITERLQDLNSRVTVKKSETWKDLSFRIVKC